MVTTILDIKNAIEITKRLLDGKQVILGSKIWDNIYKIQLEALEKKLANPVVESEHEGLTYYHCPNCEYPMSINEPTPEFTANYCNNCGQALDWRDKND